MIRFSCKCGFEFNVTEDRAGAVTQCPRCGLLVDVPSADELAWLSPDGTIGVDDVGNPTVVPGQTLAEMYKAFSRHRVDEAGVEKDLRPGAGHFDRIGNPPSVETHRPERIAPRYDPDTGERIIPLPLKDEVPQPVLSLGVEVDPSELAPPQPVRAVVGAPRPAHRTARAVPVAPIAVEALPVEALPVEPLPVEPLPVAAIPVRPIGRVRELGYATGAAARPTTTGSMAVDLLVRPANLVVLLFVSVFVVMAFLLKMPLTGIALFFGFSPVVAQLLNFPMWALAAHYGCVVEDTGPDAIDELPRPLRNFSPGDDLFAPGIRVALAVVLCYGPAFAMGAVTGLGTPPTTAITLSLAAVGAYFFPAVVLTLLTGSTVLNLTPGRVLGTIRECGGQYVPAAFLAGAVMVGTVLFLFGPSVFTPLGRFAFAHAGDRFAVLVPGLFLTTYLAHVLGWMLGLMYRAHHDAFPWLAQRHIRTPRPRQTLSA